VPHSKQEISCAWLHFDPVGARKEREVECVSAMMGSVVCAMEDGIVVGGLIQLHASDPEASPLHCHTLSHFVRIVL
jgi:hypothetical protein